MEPGIRSKAEKIRWILLDVDGVLTDGSITYDSAGGETKTFHVRDGHGIKLALRAGLQVGLITGRESVVVSRRAEELGIREVHQGAKNKVEVYEKMARRLGLVREEVAYVGDDVVDLPLFRRVGLSAAVADADHGALVQADLVLSLPGGRGAVREFVEIILKAQDKWGQVTKRYYEAGNSPVQ